jgi:Protein of unknown function (DUF1257)
MSHLSILPTVLRDETVLFQALHDLGLTPEVGAVLRGFADERQSVTLRVQLPEGLQVGWTRQNDGSLALVGDLQRLARSRSVQQWIGRITRRYAALLALRTAEQQLPGASIALAS